MSLIIAQDDFQSNDNNSTLSDHEAAKISQETYKRNQDFITVDNRNKSVTYNVIETIRDEETGLHGYVLENEETKEIIISFEGTHPSEGLAQSAKDIIEDGKSIVLGGENYAVEQEVNYHGTSSQHLKLITGEAQIKDNQLVIINKNQFTEADKVVKTYVKKYGEDNITFVGHSLGGALAEYFAVKYNSNAVTFAAANIYNILTAEEKKKVDQGEFKNKIISYKYPDDIVGSYNYNSIGSTYYLADPTEVGFWKWFTNHSIKNYLNDDMFDHNGYYIADLIINEGLVGTLPESPLALKNSGVSDFHILIKTAILMDFVVEVQSNATRIENTEKSFLNFWDFYADEMKALKVSYESKVGIGEYDMLHLTDVEEIFEEFGKTEDGVPLIFSMNQFEELLHDTKEFYLDTDEIAFYMNKMSEDFEEMDELLAQWLDY